MPFNGGGKRMVFQRLNQLFARLFELTGVPDIAYHEIKDARLCPVLKTNTDKLGIEKWKSVHGQSPVYIEHDQLLSDIVKHPRPLTVQDVKNDRRSPGEFFLFGIDSILILPVLKDKLVKGIVVVASIGKPHHFSEQKVKEAELFLESYRDVFQV
jgi:acetolactate synthase-1/2/3 large subunit